MKRNSILWCDSTGTQRRFAAIDTSEAAVDDVLRTAMAMHRSGAAQWVIYFGDGGTPIKRWGVSPEQAKVIAGLYKPVTQSSGQRAKIIEQNSNPMRAGSMPEGWQGLQVSLSRRRGDS